MTGHDPTQSWGSGASDPESSRSRAPSRSPPFPAPRKPAARGHSRHRFARLSCLGRSGSQAKICLFRGRACSMISDPIKRGKAGRNEQLVSGDFGPTWPGSPGRAVFYARLERSARLVQQKRIEIQSAGTETGCHRVCPGSLAFLTELSQHQPNRAPA